MPIFVYQCPEGHRTEFLKLHKDEPEPKYCEVLVNYVKHYTDKCGLPLEKVIVGTHWKYTRGKNPSWPLADPVDPTPQGPDEVY